jgi:copper homeostasis protein
MPVTKPYHLEACVTHANEARDAELRGADRIELCSRLETEGMTPGLELVQHVLEVVNIPVRIMLRETENGFEADDRVLEKMLTSIRTLNPLPIDGYVLGIVNHHIIDREKMLRLIDACGHHHITFHKAIDLTQDIESEIGFLNTCETIDTILTSGGAVRAADGIEMILKMKGMFQGHIMAAGKILKADLDNLHQQLGLNWYHGRAIV